MSFQLHKILLKWNKNSALVIVAETTEQSPVCYTRLSQIPTGPAIQIRSSVLQCAQGAPYFYKETMVLCTFTGFQTRDTQCSYRHWVIFPVFLVCSSFSLIYDYSYIYNIYFNIILQRYWGVKKTKYLSTCLATVLICLNSGMFLHALPDGALNPQDRVQAVRETSK